MSEDDDEGPSENEDPHEEDAESKRTDPLQRIGLLGRTALVWVKLFAQLTKLFS